ncbi:MAG: DUF4340 domain-containing protein [Anaerolineales bacterium]
MIRRNTWITMGLFAVILAGAVLWTKRGGSSTATETPTPTQEPVWTFSPEDVVALQVQSIEDGSVIRARRDAAAGWVLEEPSAPYADTGRLEIAAASLASMRPASRLESVNLSDFGLQPPLYQISVDLQDGSTQVLEIGRAAPTGNYVYAKLPFDGAVLFLQSFSVQDVTGLLDPPPVATPTATIAPTGTSTPGAPEITPTP